MAVQFGAIKRSQFCRSGGATWCTVGTLGNDGGAACR